MRKYLLFLFSLFCLITFVNAQEEVVPDELQYSELSTDSIAAEVGFIPESLDANVDSLLRSWHVQYFAKKEEHCHDDNVNVKVSDDVYRMRLESLPRVIPLTFNNLVRNCIDLYGDRRRDLVRYMLGMADFYFPIIEPILDAHDLPIELKYLAVVESALNPVALSRVGASGMWQFMLPTGKNYGLEINSLVDERRDPVKATDAACRYFKDMYAIYGDWHLVIASYNCGPGNINKAIRRAGGKRDFWEIYPYLPKETRSYVPLFIAANYIMNYYCEHNLCPVQTTLPLATDTIMVDKMLHMGQVADMLNVDIELLRALNPQYRRDIIPGNPSKASVLKLPTAETFAFIDKEDTVYLHRADELLANCLPWAITSTPQMYGKEKITHVVKNGENLHVIGNQYGVTAREIRRWNGLGSNRVPVGKRLTLHVDNGGVSFASVKPAEAVKNTTSPAKTETAQAVKTNSAAKTQSTAAAPAAKTTEKGFVSYKVKSGDSLYTISKKYPGVSATNIQKVNGLSDSRIRPGQVLKIPVG